VSGGAIVMFAGESINLDPKIIIKSAGRSSEVVVESVVRCLLFAHHHSIFHCDIRPRNVLRFNIPDIEKMEMSEKGEDSQIFLIDWDHGIGPTDKDKIVTVQRDSGQAQVCSLKICSQLDHESEINVIWSATEDILMLARYIAIVVNC
jgi:hypothetical protein